MIAAGSFHQSQVIKCHEKSYGVRSMKTLWCPGLCHGPAGRPHITPQIVVGMGLLPLRTQPHSDLAIDHRSFLTTQILSLGELIILSKPLTSCSQHFDAIKLP